MVDPVEQHVAAAASGSPLTRQDACCGGQCSSHPPRDAEGLLNEPGAGGSFEIGIDQEQLTCRSWCRER
jgi:hypothetical protein